MIITIRELKELFLSDIEWGVPVEYIEIIRKKYTQKLNNMTIWEIVEQAKIQWNWKLEIIRSNTFIITT